MPVYPMYFQPEQGPTMQDYIQKGMQTAVMPSMLGQDMQRQGLANALAGVNLQSAPQMNQADIADKLAQAQQARAQAGYLGTEAGKNQFLLNNPLMMMPGIGGTIGSLAYAQQHYPQMFSGQNGQANGMPSVGDIVKSQITYPAVRADYMKQRMQSADFNSMTPDFKNQVLAQAGAFGLDATEAVQRFNQGQNLSDIADSLGYGRDKSQWPDASNSYALTAGQRSQIQNRNASVAELNSIGPTLTAATAPYAQRIAGYSPQQVMDSIKLFSNEAQNNPQLQEKLSQFLAARAITPEYNAIRLRATGVKNIGVEAMRDMGNASMNNFKAYQGLVTPQVYSRAQELVDQMVNQMKDSANKVVANPYPKAQGAALQNAFSQKDKNNDPLGIR